MKRLFSFRMLFLLAALMLTSTTLSAQEPYAVLSGDNTVLAFYYDNNKAARNGMDVGPFTESDYKVKCGWDIESSNIRTVVFDASFAACTSLTSTAYWFYGCNKLATITGISNLNTENVTDMGWMFDGCKNLTSLDVSGFKTDNVTNMSDMFAYCSRLTSLDLSGFKTDNVTNMSDMFHGCSSLTSLDVSGFKTDNVKYIYGMFARCSGLTSLDVSNFKTDNVTNMGHMFFLCPSLTSLDLSGFKTDNVTNMSDMFHGCSSLTSLDVSGFKTDNVEGMSRMFNGCSSLTTIYVSDLWSTEKVTDGNDMFTGSTKLVGGMGTAYDAAHVDHTYARIDGGESAPGYFTQKTDTSVELTKVQQTQDGGAWYSLDGIRLTGQPAQKGIYVKDGRKVVVK